MAARMAMLPGCVASACLQPLKPPPPPRTSIPGAALCTEVALSCRPRYHVASGKKVFYARAPYLNADLGAGGHVTRFIGLGEVRS